MKIDLDWIQKELDAGRKVELEYLGGISNYGHAGEYARFLKSAGTVIVDGIENGCLNIKNTWYVINDEYLKYFRIKRPSNYDPIEGEGTLPSLNLQGKGTPIYSEINFQNSDPDLSDKPTFDDLIDVAVQAQKDGLIHKVEIISRRSIYVSEMPTSKSAHFNLTSIEAGISFINSLYTETFVIESVEDCNKFKGEVNSLVLANGEDIIDDVMFHRCYPHFTTDMVGTYKLPFKLLKGATVTQKRG